MNIYGNEKADEKVKFRLKVGRPSFEAAVISIYKDSSLYKQVLEYYRNYVNNNLSSTVDIIRVEELNPRDSDKINLKKEYDIGRQMKETKIRIVRIKKKKPQKDIKVQRRF